MHFAAIQSSSSRLLALWMYLSRCIHIDISEIYIHFTERIHARIYVFSTQRVDRTLLCTTSTLTSHSSASKSTHSHSKLNLRSLCSRTRGFTPAATPFPIPARHRFTVHVPRRCATARSYHCYQLLCSSRILQRPFTSRFSPVLLH